MLQSLRFGNDCDEPSDEDAVLYLRASAASFCAQVLETGYAETNLEEIAQYKKKIAQQLSCQTSP